MWFCGTPKIKDGSSRFENAQTQPIRSHEVFNNPEVVTLGWYPVAPVKRLKKGKTLSWKLGRQRLVFYRGEDGKARALDAFCPHMGADLATGTVRG
ncbi:MAG: Rieske (2Fe-2S) protein, partial [Bdellovibrionia bacterium]